MRIDRPDRPAKARPGDIGEDGGADTARAGRCADHRDRCRREELLEVTNAHLDDSMLTEDILRDRWS